MLDSIMAMIADFFRISSTHSSDDFGSSSNASSSSADHWSSAEPDWQSAFGTGPDFIVPSEADSTIHSFDYTDTTYGSSSTSDFGHSNSSHHDWD